ncbi:MAG: N(4)-(beta-N-acetylglucosaminyl)-L-asparaginase, partial [Flavobacteriales bacterium]|nr:N(4)-(beta-N-acetylglucosaminyl)-L-asparaginase [Flavobacteriales bacterium]
MSNRRKFIKGGILGAIGTAIFPRIISAKKGIQNSNSKSGFPIVISTWEHGIAANKAAMKILVDGGRAIDAVESGVRVSEADPKIMSVGFGGLPDREGKVTLDACIMDETGNCGAVSFLQHIKHPISVARKIMDETPHVMLSGIGALQFALEMGFKKENLLTSKAKKKWQDWLKESEYKPIINVENHDTIGLLALDKKGNISGACTTSGLSWKMHGRVGDSPIIGAGMYVDNEVGGCCATGLGEAVMKTL